MPDGTLYSAQNFQQYVDVISNLASEHQLEYWDFNLVKKGVLTMERTDFKDESHLNGKGATKLSRCVSRLINDELTNVFYSSFLEKLEKNPDDTRN
jgi:hypothetical protein